MDKQAEQLLMMFINDGYSASGKVSKKTAIAMMKFVGQVDGLQVVVNNGCPKQITSFELPEKAAQKAAEPKWISVEDGMPEIGEMVLIEIPVCNTFNVESGEYIGGGEFYGAWCTKRGVGHHYAVSRWMPRP